MKTSEAKTAAKNLHQKQDNQPFFRREEEGAAVLAPEPEVQPFFAPPGNGQNHSPFFSPSIQPKLKIGQPGDQYEQEADAMAEKVVQRLEGNNGQPTTHNSKLPNLQPKCAECAAEEEGIQKMEGEEEELSMKKEGLQRKPIFESNGDGEDNILNRKVQASPLHLKPSTAPPSGSTASGLEARLNASKGSGAPMAEATRTSMESAFGADFSSVRVHTDTSAVQMNRELGARAFTHGSDVYFNAGQFDPRSGEGKKLLAHELTHVVQQGRGGSLKSLNKSSALPDVQKNDSPQGTLPALSAKELLDFMLSQRGFGTSSSLPLQVDPKGVGKATGKGYQTYAAVQLIDAEGKQVKVSIGAYLGGGSGHGETQAISALRNSLPEGARLEGGKMMVVVEQIPCSSCDSAIKSFANELGVSEFEIYVPQRESLQRPGTSVKPKTASTTAFKGRQGATTPSLFHSESLRTLPSSPVSDASASEIKAMVRSATSSLETDLKLLKISTYLTGALAILDGVSSILTAVEFMNMASSKLAGEGFMFSGHIKKSRQIEADAEEMAKNYPKFSEKFGESTFYLWAASLNPGGMGNVVLELAELKLQLTPIQEKLSTQIAQLEKVKEEADAKRKAALNILEDPKSSAAIAMVTFGSAELSRLFAASEDFQEISANLRRSIEDFGKVKNLIDQDLAVLETWYSYILDLCRNDPTCKEAIKSGRYSVTIMSADLDSDFWDTPDAFVKVSNGYRTSTKEDTTLPLWYENVGVFDFDELKKITFWVYDSDPISSNDLLAKIEADLTPSKPDVDGFTLRKSSVVLRVTVERKIGEN